MLFDREYKPGATDILYHYCTADTLHAICTAKKLRFCDIFSMNDFMEMHWGYQVWEQAATELLPDFGKEFLDAIDLVIHTSGIKALPLASCLSRAGDVLSQWRAYAKDGTGYAIGFNAELLNKLPVRPLQVLYDFDQQVKEVKTIVKALHEAEDSENHTRGHDFLDACARISFDLAALKNPAFAEENEVRLLHLVNFAPSNQSLRLVDPGGTSFEKPADPQPMSFFIRESVPVAHVDIDFTDSGKINPVREVFIGPKNGALSSSISVYLETMGIPNVQVKRSTASYR